MTPSLTDESDLPEVDGTELKARFEAATQKAAQSVQEGTVESDPMLLQALQQNKIYEDEINQADKDVYKRQFRDRGRRIPRAADIRGTGFGLYASGCLLS